MQCGNMATLIFPLLVLSTNINLFKCGYLPPENIAPSFGQEDFQQLLRRVNDLESKNADHERRLHQQDQELAKQGHTLAQQQSKLAQQENLLAQQESRLAQQETKISEQEKEIQALRSSTLDELTRVTGGKGPFNFSDHLEPRSRRAENEVSVGFFATLTKQLTHMGQHQDIVFDKVITNVGNGYNVHLGSFIAPVSGMYVFSVYLTAYGGVHPCTFQFTRNGQQESVLYLHGTTNTPYSSSTQMAVFQLSQGDDVQIRNVGDDGHLHSGYSSFSGFLVQQTYPSPAVVG